MIRTAFIFIGLLSMYTSVKAQEIQGVHVEPTVWDIHVEHENDTAYIVFNGVIPEGQHIYACDFVCEIGPFPAVIANPTANNGSFVGPLKSPGAKAEYDDIFECTLKSYGGKASFRQAIQIQGGHADFSGVLEYQVCLEDGMCVLQRKEFSLHAH